MHDDDAFHFRVKGADVGEASGLIKGMTPRGAGIDRARIERSLGSGGVRS